MSQEMIEVAVGDLSGQALDFAVAKCAGVEPLKRVEDHLSADGRLPYCFDLHHDIKMLYEAMDILAGRPHCSGLGAEELRLFAAEMGYVIDQPAYKPYSTDWACGGPIIEEFCIVTSHDRGYDFDQPWRCALSIDPYNLFEGPTPLVAAMRCYVGSKLGPVVELPFELASPRPSASPNF